MPEGPLGGPRPGAKSFQSVEFGVVGNKIRDPEYISDKLTEHLGVDNVGLVSSEDTKGGMMVVPLNSKVVYIDDIQKFLDSVSDTELSTHLWGVTSRVKGPSGSIRPFAEGKQKVCVVLTKIPEWIEKRQDSFISDMMGRVQEKMDLSSLTVDKENGEVCFGINSNSVDNSKYSTIKMAVEMGVMGMESEEYSVRYDKIHEGENPDVATDEYLEQMKEINEMADELRDEREEVEIEMAYVETT